VSEISLLEMMLDQPRHPDWTEALDAYVTADRACEKACAAFEKAAQVVQQREAELRAVYERLTEEADDG